MLCATSPFEREVSRTFGANMWKSFMEGVSFSHSAQAGTLPYLIRRCEREKVNYEIRAYPGKGYFIKRAK